MIVRSYKWSKIYCAWKYPEVQQETGKKTQLAKKYRRDSENNTSLIGDEGSVSDIATLEDENGGEGEFYGLRPGEARFSKYIVRSLHRDVDPQSGTAPATIQAALGAMESALSDPINQFSEKKKKEEAESPVNGRKKVTRKAATPVLPGKKIASRRISFMCIPSDLEDQLLQSRLIELPILMLSCLSN